MAQPVPVFSDENQPYCREQLEFWKQCYTAVLSGGGNGHLACGLAMGGVNDLRSLYKAIGDYCDKKMSVCCERSEKWKGAKHDEVLEYLDMDDLNEAVSRVRRAEINLGNCEQVSETMAKQAERAADELKAARDQYESAKRDLILAVTSTK